MADVPDQGSTVLFNLFPHDFQGRVRKGQPGWTFPAIFRSVGVVERAAGRGSRMASGMSDTKQGDPPIYSLSEICNGLRDLEMAMERDPVCTVWALPVILERRGSMPLPLASSGDSESSDLQGDSAEDSL